MSTRPAKPAAPEQPVAVLIMVHVPPTFRGLSKAEVRRKLSHPANVEITLDSIADTVVKYFNKPVDYAEVMTLLASQRRATGDDADARADALGEDRERSTARTEAPHPTHYTRGTQ